MVCAWCVASGRWEVGEASGECEARGRWKVGEARVLSRMPRMQEG